MKGQLKHILHQLFLILIIGVFPVLALKDKCNADNDFFSSMPPSIGNPADGTTTFYPLPCDTMYVRSGVKVVVHPGTWLYFQSPSATNLIHIEGELVLQGSSRNPVRLSSGIDSSGPVNKTGKQFWSGMEVSERGSLKIEHIVMSGAPNPIVSLSKDVIIKDAFFIGSGKIQKPDGKVYRLDPEGERVEFISFNTVSGENLLRQNTTETEPLPPTSSSDSVVAENKAERPVKWKKKLYWGAGIAAVTGTAIGILLFDSKEDKISAKPSIMKEGLPPFPERAE